MSQNKKEKVLHVDNLTIYAKDVEIISNRKEEDSPRRDPWGFFWGRPRTEVSEQELEEPEVQEPPSAEEKE